jgi:hypothetical protein
LGTGNGDVAQQSRAFGIGRRQRQGKRFGVVDVRFAQGDEGETVTCGSSASGVRRVGDLPERAGGGGKVAAVEFFPCLR